MSNQAFREQEGLVGMVEDLLAIGRLRSVLPGILCPDPWRTCRTNSMALIACSHFASRGTAHVLF